MAQLKSTTIYGDLRVTGTTTFNEDLYTASIYLEEDANSSYFLRILNNSGLTANKTLTVNVNNGDRTLTLNDDFTVGSLTSGYAIYASANDTISSEQYLAVQRGGTGVGTFTANRIITGNGTSGLLNPGPEVTASALTFTNAANNSITTSATAAGTVGRALTIYAGSTTAGTANINGGDLYLYSGNSTGSGNSGISFYTSPAGTAGATTLNGQLLTATLSRSVSGTGKLGLIDTGGDHYLFFAPGSSLSASRTLTFTTGDADRTITLSGNLNIANDFTTSGNYALTLTTTASTNATIPSGTVTLMDLGTAQSVTGTKTFSNSAIRLLGSSTGYTTFSSANTSVSNYTITIPADSTTMVGTTTSQTLTNKTLDDIKATGGTTTADLWSEVTTGSITLGAGLTTGTLNLDASSTGTHTTNLATGVTAASATKTVNIGTGGALDSTTNINIGSSTASAGGTTTIYSPTLTIAGSASIQGSLTVTGTLNYNSTVAGHAFYAGPNSSSPAIPTWRTIVDADLPTTLDSHTITSPKMSSTSILDTNGNQLITFPAAVASAVNELTISNAATTASPSISATGGDDNIGINLITKGTAGVNVTGSLTVTGDFTVQGTTVFVDTTNLQVEDNNIELGKVTTPTNTTANGGGITLLAGTDVNKTITWDSANTNWTSSEHWNIASSKSYKINNTSVLNATTLGSGVTASSLTSVGTLTSLTVSGATALNGTVGLGDAAADVITLNGTFASATGIKIFDSDGTTYTYTISPGNIGANTALTLPTAAGTFVITDQTTGKVNLGSTTYVTGTLPVGNGGTGATTFTANAILTGNTTSAIQVPGPTLSATTMAFTGAGTINSATTNALTLDSGTTGAVNLGTNANAKTITIGNATGATSVVVNSGTAGVTFNQVAAGIFKVQASAAPTTDMVQITNSGMATVTAGVNALNVTYVGGAAAVESSAIRADMTPGGTTGGTWSSLRIVNGASATGVVTNGVKFDTKTAGAGTANVLWVGTGWDNILNYNETTVINGTGNLIAGQLSGTIPSAVLGNSSVYLGTTAVALNRGSAALTLAGITLTDGTLDNIKASAVGTAVDLWSETTTGNMTIGTGLSTGTFTVGATGSTGAVSLFPATGSQAITLGGATTGTITIGSTGATAVQLPTGKTKIGQTILAQGGAVTVTLPTAAGTLVGSGDTGTVTNTMLAGSIANTKLSNSTISGVALGGTLYALSSGAGLTGNDYTGAAAITFDVGAGTGITVNTNDVAITSIVAEATTVGALKYNGTTALAGALDGGTTTPTGTSRLNYGGYLYSTRTYSTMIKAGTVGAPVEAVHIAGNLRIDDASDNAGFKMVYDNTAKSLQFNYVGV